MWLWAIIDTQERAPTLKLRGTPLTLKLAHSVNDCLIGSVAVEKNCCCEIVSNSSEKVYCKIVALLKM